MSDPLRKGDAASGRAGQGGPPRPSQGKSPAPPLLVRDTGPRAGPTPTLVLLHYFGGSSREWDPVIERVGRECRCVAPDLPGFGHSPALPDTADYVRAYTDAVLEGIAARGLDRWVLVGHSMGGKIALAAAARRPAGLAALVLVAPSPPTPEPMSDADRERLLAGYGRRDAAIETARRIIVAPVPAYARAMVVDDCLRADRGAWDGWLERGSREDLAGLAGQVAVPARVLAGGDDPVMHANMLAREVRDRVPGATMTLVPGSGHLVPLEAPDPLAAALREVARAAGAPP